MKDTDLRKIMKKSFWEGVAVMTIVVTVTAFLCFLTTFEFVALKMEWNVPALTAVIGDSDSYVFEKEREEQEKLEQSAENVVAEEIPKMTDDAEQIEKPEQQESAEEAEPADSSEMPDVTEIAEAAEEDEFPYYIKINRQQNVVTVYEKDDTGAYTVPVRAILCSTGLYNATPKGIFSLSTKYIWHQLNGGVFGQYATRITGGVLFHSVPYASKKKDTLYTDKYNKLGEQASMGCVRLTVEDAKWIYDNCPSGTQVEVYDSDNPGPLGKPETIKIDKDNVNKGWDPTDPDERNPWHSWSEDE